MAKIIITIHGLGNKPPENLLTSWWRLAIEEGLSSIGKPHYFMKFYLAYWAHFLHPQQLDPAIKDPDHPLYLPDPYVPGKNNFQDQPKSLRKKFLDIFKRQMSHVLLDTDFTMRYGQLSDLVIHYFYQDLEVYYSSNSQVAGPAQQSARTAIQNQLIRILRTHSKKDILLIAHSMGSIIAYDVLKQLESEVNIDTLVTIGSPLGLAAIQRRLHHGTHSENKKDLHLPTPDNILRFWFNFADSEDKVAMDYQLAEDFEKNRHGVQPMDYLVHNNYELHGERNPHKAYGYLRTRQLAEVINNFINSDRYKISIWVGDKINRFWGEKKVKYESR